MFIEVNLYGSYQQGVDKQSHFHHTLKSTVWGKCIADYFKNMYIMSCPYQKFRSRTNIKTVLHSTLEDKFYWLFSKKKKDNFMFNVELSDETK